MILKDLKKVLLGRIRLYEMNPDRDPEDIKTYFKDLYSGNRNDIPEEFLRREVLLINPPAPILREPCTDIQLFTDA